MLYFSGKGCSEFPKKVLILIGILICLTDQENEQIVSVYINFQQIGKKPKLVLAPNIKI